MPFTNRLSSLNKNKISQNFPTIKQFNKYIEPIINTQKPVVQIGPVKPILPEYLVEKPVNSNPFQDIKESKINDLKNAEKSRKLFDSEKKNNFSVTELVNRDICIKFNANYKTKLLKYEIDLEELTIDSPEKPIKKTYRSKSISNYDFIVDKRKICLLDLAINMKQEQFIKLEDIIKKEEKYIESENKRLKQEHDAHDKYLKRICQKTSNAIKVSEMEAAKKNSISETVKVARYNMAHLNAECVKLEEDYLRLKTYQEFLRNCFEHQKQKQMLERKSRVNDEKLTAILKSMNLENKNHINTSTDTESLTSKSIHTFDELESNLNVNNEANRLTFDDLQKLKEYILTGFDDSKNNNQNNVLESIKEQVNSQNEVSDNLVDDSALVDQTYFQDPQELVNILSELESNNLSLIENVQEQEELCEHMRGRITHIKHEMTRQICTIDKHIRKEQAKIDKLQESIKCIKETENFLASFDNLDRYKKLFYFGNLNVKTPDEMMDYLQEKITDLYNAVFDKSDSTKWNTIEMLKQIEMLVDSLYIDLQKYDKSTILKSKKIVDERKRKTARLRQKEICKEAELMKIQKAMEKALQPPRYNFGRKIMHRSEPPKPEIKESVINWNEIKEREELNFFFQ